MSVDGTQIERAFTYNETKEEHPVRYKFLYSKAKDLAITIDNNVPNCREKSLALTKLEEAIMWAHAGMEHSK